MYVTICHLICYQTRWQQQGCKLQVSDISDTDIYCQNFWGYDNICPVARLNKIYTHQIPFKKINQKTLINFEYLSFKIIEILISGSSQKKLGNVLMKKLFQKNS
eukprot:TRINITY_DN18918_c0_g1_i3.p1 TRINITY_DN18918_c0_g1~~TRINITY_DN18918_c0_g1_i3.p1  ORF type:complete len:104 (+),score=1.73 TRINITY_DN18918_c0_g1_i3:299-610(+)